MTYEPEHGQDLYLRGVAAAQAHDNAEARLFLEWALQEWDAYGEYDREKRTEVNLWLSRVSDDPQKKREYLETVLAIDPTNAEARRDLAILDGRLKPEDIADLNKPVTPVTPDASPPSADVHRYTCPQCGGKLSYDVRTGALTCQFCGYRAGAEPQPAITTGDFVATVFTARGHRWELPTARTLKCQGCGANFTLPPAQIAGACPFCGSAHIVETPTPRGTALVKRRTAPSAPARGPVEAQDAHEFVEPTGVIPFQFDTAAATQHVQQWLHEQKLTATFTRPRAVYLPFWSFDMEGQVAWRGLVKVQRETDGQTVWTQHDGSELAIHDSLLVCASRSLDAQLAGQVAEAGFDQLALAPYDEKYLVDWPAEVYQIALADASLVAHERVFAQAQQRIRQGPAAEARELSLDPTGIVINTYKLLLCPLWLGELRAGAQQFPYTVNGQSGKVHANLPRSGLDKVRAWIAS